MVCLKQVLRTRTNNCAPQYLWCNYVFLSLIPASGTHSWKGYIEDPWENKAFIRSHTPHTKGHSSYIHIVLYMCIYSFWDNLRHLSKCIQNIMHRIRRFSCIVVILYQLFYPYIIWFLQWHYHTIASAKIDSHTITINVFGKSWRTCWN